MSKYTYSASQVKTFRDCNRKWAFDKIDRIPRQGKDASASRGSLLHEVLEQYLKDGSLPKDEDLLQYKDEKTGEVLYQCTGKEAVANIINGIEFLPTPGTMRTEERFEIELGRLGRIIGYIDFEDDELVGDHKTTTNYDYAPTEEELLEDPQATIYAVKKLKETDAKEVRLRWVYYQVKTAKKEPASKKVEVVMPLKKAVENFSAVSNDIVEMKKLRDSGKSANEIDFNLSACDKYRGCPYREKCKVSQKERIKHLLGAEGPEMSYLDKLRKGNAPKAEEPAINPPENVLAKNEKTPEVSEPEPAISEKPTPEPKKVAKKKTSKKKTTKKTTKPSEGVTVLYLDCRPVKGDLEVVDFSALLAEANEKVKKENGVAHYRQIPNLYGAGPAALQELLAETSLPGHLTVNTKMPEAQDALGYLLEKAAVVVTA